MKDIEIKFIRHSPKVLIPALVATLVVACSSTPKRTIASVDDVGIVGPDGAVTLFFRDGDRIVVRVCEKNTVLYSPETPVAARPAESRKNCVGRENRVPVAVFERELRKVVAPGLTAALRPLTEEEAKLAIAPRLSDAEIASLRAEEKKIREFIATYGAANSDESHARSVFDGVSSYDAQTAAVRKLDDLLESTIETIMDDSVAAVAKFSDDKNEFLYTVLSHFNPRLVFPCGNSGSISERVKDCAMTYEPERSGWKLVTRTDKFVEVWEDPIDRKLWIDGKTEVFPAVPVTVCPTIDAIPGVKFHQADRDELSRGLTAGLRQVFQEFDIKSSTPSERIFPYASAPEMTAKQKRKFLKTHPNYMPGYWYAPWGWNSVIDFNGADTKMTFMCVATP